MSYLTLSAIIPPATIFPTAALAAPTGWLMCEGQAVSRTTYAALFAAIGTTYGAGDGSTTFNLPDTRGIFLRGAGSQSILGVQHSGVLGQVQNDQMQGHLHNMNIRVSADDAGGGSIASGSTSTALQSFRGFFGATGDLIGEAPGYGTPRLGDHTRPANLTVNFVIKT